MKKKKRMIITISIISIIVLAVMIYKLNPQLGGKISNDYKRELGGSPNFNGEVFENPIATKMAAPSWETMKEFLKKGVDRKPTQPISTEKFNAGDFESKNDSSDIKFSWFGHSSVLLKIEGKNLLIDPVFSKRASMFSWMGPKRFDYENQMTVENLPQIDAVLISHDHYDHLDYRVIKKLKDRVKQFYVPLGVRVHLEKWGVPPENITDLDWWDEVELTQDLKITLTPARHFTGRGLTNRMTTLWGGWAFLGTHGKVFFSGDSGYFNGFKEMGEKFGSFDLAFIECGQYNVDWEAIHMLPEQSAQAAEDVRAKFVVPIHWGKFKLSTHSWIEPIERFLNASENKSFQTLTPKPNELVCLSEISDVNFWWRR